MVITLHEDETPGADAVTAIRAGDVQTLRRLLDATPGLATAMIARRCGANGHAFSYPLIGAATDWPGRFPNVSATIAVLVDAGADVNARCAGPHRETPLHGAASNDDVAALDALLDAGADIEAPGAVIAGGTPLDDAVAFAQWSAARRLVERGAQTALWHAAALGLRARLEEIMTSPPPPARYPWGKAVTSKDAITLSFWCACHGGQRRAAEYLLERGADLNWTSPWDGLSPLDAARRSGADDVVEWLSSLGAKSARQSD